MRFWSVQSDGAAARRQLVNTGDDLLKPVPVDILRLLIVKIPVILALTEWRIQKREMHLYAVILQPLKTIPANN